MRNPLINTTGREKTVFSFLGERVLGLTYIVDGVSIIIVGGRHKGLSLRYCLWGSYKSHEYAELDGKKTREQEQL